MYLRDFLIVNFVVKVQGKREALTHPRSIPGVPLGLYERPHLAARGDLRCA